MATLINNDGETLAISPTWSADEVGMKARINGSVMLRQGDDLILLSRDQIAKVAQFLTAVSQEQPR